MIKKILMVCCVAVLITGIFGGCGQKYDAETVADVSILQEGQDPYDLTCLDLADMMDVYIKFKDEKYKRGTDKYADFLYKSKSDKELGDLPEWPALELFIDAYSGLAVGGMKYIELDDDKLPVEMTDKTIREYAYEQWGMEL